MLSEATRPPWLYQKHKLEEFVQEHNWTLNIVQLRCDRNRCQLVDNILEKIALKERLNPSEFEKGLARNHLAVDLQNILQRWCDIGLQKTMEGSALLGSAQKPTINQWAPVIHVERFNAVPKVEVASPEATTFNYVGSGDSYQQPRTRDTFPSSQQLPLSSRPVKRPLGDADQNDDVTKMPRIDRASSFTCPYYARNKHSPDHAQCADKTFPNPRKLKEHVWRWLKPFKCANCGEGFGREKTRAIHCEQRKTKCKKAVSTYEHSAEWHRDLQIESAKSTDEMIRIFDEYEKKVTESKSQNPNNREGSSAESEGSCSSPEPQNDSPNSLGYNPSDSEMDGSGGEPKYETPRLVELVERGPPMAARPRSESLHQTHILREGSGPTLEGLTHDCSSGTTNGHQLSPSWPQGGDLNQFNPPQTRRKSEPLVHYSSITSNNFSQEPSVGSAGVPQITITHHEPPLDFGISFEPEMYQMQDEIRETSCMDPMDEGSQNDFSDIGRELQMGNRSGSQTVILHSPGYGSIPSFNTRFRF